MNSDHASNEHASSGSPNPEEFDALVIASRNAVNKLGVQALWKAVLALPSWYFAGAATDLAEPDALEPIVANVEGVPRLLAFTDEVRAEAFADWRTRIKGVTTSVLHMETADAIAYGNSLIQARISGYLVNSGMHSFEASFEDVSNMYKKYIG